MVDGHIDGPVTALEYMEKRVQKHRQNFDRESARGVPEEMLRDIEKKIGYYEAAVEALMVPQTHGDHIRSMPDKGLAELLTMGTGGFFCLECMRITGNECDGCCTEHCEKWLGEPVKGGSSDAAL